MSDLEKVQAMASANWTPAVTYWKLKHDAELRYAERLRAALRECEEEIDQYIRQEYPLDHPVHELYRQRDFSANPARIALEASA